MKKQVTIFKGFNLAIMFIAVATICLMSQDADAQTVHSYLSVPVHNHGAPVHSIYYHHPPIHNVYYHNGYIPHYGYGGYGGYGYGAHGGNSYYHNSGGYRSNSHVPYPGYIPF